MALSSAQAAPAEPARRRAPWRKHLPAYLFLLPNFLGVLVFIAFPVLFALYMSLTNWDGITTPKFLGLGNFHDLIQDQVFWYGVRNTFIYTFITVPGGVVLGLGAALLLYQKVRGLSLFRAAMFVPVVTSALAVAVIWKWIFDYDNGLINDVLSLLGLNQVPWLSDPAWALISLAIIGVWQGFGLNAVILLAALEAVPDSLLEAAAIDGAGSWSRFWRVRLPLIAPAVLFVSINSFIGSFQVFAQAYYMTNGGPSYGTTVLNFLVYQRAFAQNRFGNAAAIGYVLFAIIFIVTLAQLRLSRGYVNAVAETEA
ncbi:MAG: carbohydrate ABC transporter permease [Chloroflexota bacterium]